MKNTASPIHIGFGGEEHAAMQRSSWVRINVAAAVCIAGSALVASEAIAGDAQLVPATVCQPLVERTTDTAENPNDVLDHITNIRYTHNGRVVNQSLTRRLAVVCPIVRDNTAKPLRWIRVIFADQILDFSPDNREVLECTARAVAGLGESPSDLQQIKSTDPGAFDVDTGGGTGSGVMYFRLDDVESGDPSNPNDEYHISHYTLTCEIPPRFGDQFSWIASIMIDEP